MGTKERRARQKEQLRRQILAAGARVVRQGRLRECLHAKDC